MRAIVTMLIGFGVGLAAASASADTSIQKNSGQWRVECNESDKGAVRYALRMALINKKSKAVLFGWTMLPGKDEGSNTAKVVLNSHRIDRARQISLPATLRCVLFS